LHFINYQRTVGHRRRWSRSWQRSRILQPPGCARGRPSRRALHRGPRRQGYKRVCKI